MPDLTIENQYNGIVCGIDEVGYGALAGPVFVAAVIIKPNIPQHIISLINDSKKISKTNRIKIAQLLPQYANIAIASASVEEIDKINILKATHLAMHRAIIKLQIINKKLDLALIDGNRMPNNLPIPCRCIIKGDSISTSIAAASIVAKVTRDTLMIEQHDQYRQYGWNTNMGYGTKIHCQTIKKIGITKQHRISFTKKILMQNDTIA